MKKYQEAVIARQMLDNFSSKFPGIWQIVDEFIQNNRTWDNRETFLPSFVCTDIFLAWLEKNKRSIRDPKEIFQQTTTLVRAIQFLPMFAAWRATQSIYVFDETLKQELHDSGIQGEIPVDILRNMPEWCVYIHDPGVSMPGFSLSPPSPNQEPEPIPISGVWFWLDFETANSKQADLLAYAFLHRDEEESVIQIGHYFIQKSSTIEQMVTDVYAGWSDVLGDVKDPKNQIIIQQTVQTFQKLFPMLLYLCSQQPDISGKTIAPIPKKTKRGWRFFPPNQPQIREVGVHIGAAIRQAASKQPSLTEAKILGPVGHRASPRPHIRRAHWHTYWTGPNRQIPQLRWIPPVPVKITTHECIPTTIRQVLGESYGRS